MTRGLFVTGTDTGVGKTVVAGAVAAALTRRGARVAAFKPVVTGLEEPAARSPRRTRCATSRSRSGCRC
jgi:dethiobiotin synthetase